MAVRKHRVNIKHGAGVAGGRTYFDPSLGPPWFLIDLYGSSDLRVGDIVEDLEDSAVQAVLVRLVAIEEFPGLAKGPLRGHEIAVVAAHRQTVRIWEITAE